jgi:hypothetical protein
LRNTRWEEFQRKDGYRFLRDSLEKTGRRLTSDPIRTSLGLLPSGPDPVGEWLVHRQSPGPYLGPKEAESKRGIGCHTPPPGLAFGEPDDRLPRGVKYLRRLDTITAALEYWIIRFRG